MFLVVTRNFPPDVGGIQSLMGGLAENLLNHGPVKVFTYEFENSKEYDLKSTLNIERVKGIKLFKKFRKSNLVNDFIDKNPNIRAIFVDHWKSLEIIKIENLKKIKTFCLLHSKEINHEVGTSINKRIIKITNNSDYVIANSNFTKNLAIKIGIDASKIHVIFPGISIPNEIDPYFKKEAANYYQDSFPKIITVARLEKRKSHDKILMSIKNLKSKYPRVKYISVGSGKEKEKLLNLTKELKLEDHVLFLNNIDHNLKNALVSASDLFVMPSRIDNKSIEGFGIAFVEAASYGVGSIGGKDGGESDAIIHNETGLICDGNSLNSIFESIVTFFENKKNITYGNNAKNFSKKFHWNEVVKKYLKLIN